MDKVRRMFADPPAKYRGAPFWSWNDLLDPKELVQQVHDMKAHGMGGFFMHSRVGLETPYLGEEWMACIRETVKAAKKAGMNAWLYDEDRWPSGFAGGLVAARGGDAFRSKVLTLEIASGEVRPSQDVVATYRAKLQDGGLVELHRVEPKGTIAPHGEESILVLRREVSGPTDWYNDDAPPDNLNPDSVAAFLDITYEAYRREVGNEFGKAVPGIFTDEPNIGTVSLPEARPRVPWTDGFAEYFKQRRGYDFLDAAPYVFLDGEHSPKARHDYWWTATERYVEAFSKQLGQWCDAHDLAFTGHYLCENDLGSAIVLGGAIMPHYRYQAVPGIDLLCEQCGEYLTVKQCTSVAHQDGRELVLSETYGCSGWEFTFEGQKWVGDWQYVLGVSLRCQHLTLYTLRGCRKRDYPPSFNYNTSWWKYNGVVEDYFARLGAVLTQGKPVRDVLVIHPVTTGWMMVGEVAHAEGARALGVQLSQFVRTLLACHYDFDFGDELIMAEAAKAENGRLVVGQAPYKVVVIPPGTQSLLQSTLELLKAFAESGGRVIAFGPGPAMLEALADDRLEGLMQHARVSVLSNEGELQDALEAAVPREVSILDEHGREAPSFLYMLRRLDGGRSALCLVNNDREVGHHVRVALVGSGSLEEWDPLTGQITSVPVEAGDDTVAFSADFGPAGSRLYVLDPSRRPAEAGETETETVGVSYIGPACKFERTDPNVLTLDVCAYRVRDSEWSESVPVWQAQKAVREQLGMPPVFYNSGVQRHKWVHQSHENDGTPVKLRFEFTVQQVPDTPVHLLLENAEDFSIKLNGEAVPSQAAGWYLDRSFDRVPLPTLRVGASTLELSCAYRQRMEVEDCFLIGDFGVSVERAITAEPERLHFGDWCTQGYFHYAGSIIYHGEVEFDPKSGEQVKVELGDHSAVAVAVHINGKLAGHIPWRSANGLDIAQHLKQGINTIGIEVVASPRNMLGPLHLKAGYERGTSSASFRTEGDRYTPDYVLQPYGLFGQVRIVRERQAGD